MKYCWPLMAILSTVTLYAAVEDPPEKPQNELIQGTWQVVALEAGGRQASEDSLKNKRFLIEGSRISLSGKPEDLRKYQLHTDTTPKGIDLPGSVDGQFSKGIYELKANALKLCFSQSTNEERPKGFNTDGTKYLCFTLKRAQPKDDDSAKLLELIQGEWQRTVDKDGTTIRVVKAIGKTQETLTYYLGEQVVYAHRVDFKVTATEAGNVFSYENLTIMAGPSAGQTKDEKGSYVFKVDSDTWYEIHRMLPGEKGAPWITTYDRVKQRSGGL